MNIYYVMYESFSGVYYQKWKGWGVPEWKQLQDDSIFLICSWQSFDNIDILSGAV